MTDQLPLSAGAEATEAPLDIRFAYGLCHALTAAFLRETGSGEALALVVETEIRHTVYRPAHTQVYLDAHGQTTDLAIAARRYVRAGELWQWLPVDEATVEKMAAGANRSRLRSLISMARPLARSLLART
jgi:hypothetical protein